MQHGHQIQRMHLSGGRDETDIALLAALQDAIEIRSHHDGYSASRPEGTNCTRG
ncbi:hypothetical protein ACWCSD_40695 [Nonomuraea sp. NPDC001684]